MDWNLGRGGHDGQILDRRERGGRQRGMDGGLVAVEAARSALASHGPAVVIVDGRFGELDALARGAGFVPADCILFDFGLSSVRLDAPERGFSFRGEGPLDMRMDTTQSLDAARIVNEVGAEELEQVLRDLGE